MRECDHSSTLQHLSLWTQTNYSDQILRIPILSGLHITEAETSDSRKNGSTKQITLKCRIDTESEIEYVKNCGVLHYVLRNLAKAG